MTFIKKEKGFTLIELMVVVAILAILAIVAIPRILSALENARRSEAVATATTIANAVERYYIEHEIYPNLTPAVGDTGANLLLDTVSADAGDDYPPLSNYLDVRNLDSFAVAVKDAAGGDTYAHATNDKNWMIELTFSAAHQHENNAVMRAEITRDKLVWPDATD